MKGKRIAVLGPTYKPNTDDMRDAPRGSWLSAAGGGDGRRLRPGRGERTGPRHFYPASSSPAALRLSQGADALVVVTEWDAFRALDLVRMKAALRDWSIDLRNIYPIKAMKALGFRYVCVGRGFGGEG